MLLCWSPKGGCGTTTVAGALAVTASNEAPTWFVDLAGDGPALFGVDADGPGVFDWLGSAVSTADSLRRLACPVTDSLSVIPAGQRRSSVTDDEWGRLGDLLRDTSCVVDAGRHPPAALATSARQCLLVVRNCYLAAWRAARRRSLATGVVLVEEPGRSLGASDIEAALQLPVLARVALDPAVRRCTDDGCFAQRVPRNLLRQLRALR